MLKTIKVAVIKMIKILQFPQKLAVFIVLIGLSFVLSGCDFLGQKKLQVEKTIKDETQMMKAIGSGESIYCNIEGENGEKIEFWSRQSKNKAQVVDPENQQVNYMINDGQFMYVWQQGNSQGMKMAIPSPEELADLEQQQQDVYNQYPQINNDDDIEKYQQQGYKIDCKNQQIGDDQFALPSDVEFVDFNQMMGGLMNENMEKMQEMENIESENEDAMEQVKKLQETWGQ